MMTEITFLFVSGTRGWPSRDAAEMAWTVRAHDVIEKKNMDPVLTFSIRPNFICLGCKVLNDSARRIVWYDLDKREACSICRLEPLCCLCFRVFVCFAGIGTDMTQVGRLPLEVKRMLKCVEYGEQYFLKILFSNFHYNGSHLGFI